MTAVQVGRVRFKERKIKMTNQCIICRNKFSVKNPRTNEHIIPFAIGGKKIINTVCKKCNSLLGTKIDAPFVDSFLGILHREENNILGRKKVLPSILKGNYKDSNGVTYQIKNIVSEPEILDKRPEITIHPIDNLKSAVNISFKKYGNFTEQEADLLFQKYFNYINSELAKNGLSSLTIEEIKSIPYQHGEFNSGTLSRDITVDMNPFFLEALKIAYEFFVTDYPEFIDHKDMVKIAQIIENTDLQEAKKYVSIYCIYQNTSEFNNMIKLLENVVGQIFIVCPLVTPEKKTGYILSIYKEFLFLVTLSDDNLLSEKTINHYLEPVNNC
jgi:hypothetical protein